ncbi:UDP-N-acetylenolpyruvoylglucosamine reductase [Thermodesulfatator indicus DSM 15286]|uniref:UDP-N-acetylenolpyruvoylglucosamine reductase n=1 Tax=Thermodesulfatator indicus (strain DSM 15286 / JCM 11887 / CIR29812) TaxID=667014 RepID=F8AAP2_THEID|nr:UDP-N-acetylmuramate dehydrogenase [Thermodesulfatator indicus]AEH44314.1 UDP-N-acetylenolpyruvoylglucosamine reductase [Thermodesulfatator indicus DSM 15286]
MKITNLFAKEGLLVKEKVPLFRLTTFRVGGPADYLFYPRNFLELSRGFEIFEAENIPTYFLGGGSNLLVRDGGFRGAFISLEKLDFVEFEDELVRTGAGVPLARFLTLCAERGLSGLEFMAGVPATVGGAVKMNAGAFGQEIGSLVEEVTIYQEGRFFSLSRGQLTFSYRFSSIPDEAVIVAVNLRLKKDSQEAINKRIADYLFRRKKTQPLNEPSAGCIFKNPPGFSAGALIDQAGLKGLRAGGAEISRKHANFIVNRDGARAQDILRLINFAKERVFQLFGMELEEELRVVGEG